MHDKQSTNYFKIKLMVFHQSTLVARGANTQLDPGCVSAPLATSVDLFACFAKINACLNHPQLAFHRLEMYINVDIMPSH